MDIQRAELDDARRGALYFLGNTTVERRPSLDLGVVGNFVGDTTLLNDMKSVCGSLVENIPGGKFKPLERLAEITVPLRDMLRSFFEAIGNKILEIFGEAMYGVEWVAEFVSWGLSVFSGGLASAIPGWGYVQSAGDLYSGVKKAVMSARDLVSQLYAGHGVQLLDGLPNDIAKSLARHSAVGVAGGVKDAGIATVSIGLEAGGDATAGAGTIVSVVTGILQRIANLVDWCIQKFRVSAVLKQAAGAWDTRDEPDSMVRDQKAFGSWFSLNVVCTPILAAVVLSSGLVAHPYRFLALFGQDDEVIDQKAYDDGVVYIEQLKKLSSRYLKSYSDNYKCVFKSADDFVSARLIQAVS